MTELSPGLRAETEITVTEADTAARWGSGLVPVYSTPALVGQMENTAVVALNGHLPPGQTTVGGRIDIRHLAPTPVGMKVRAVAELTEIQGRKLVFRIEAWDEVEKVGEATHERFIIDEAKFMTRVRAKGTTD
ncbi:MAG: thioesterase [Anaerolineae bacterium]|nr:MAG: thioesterase [Anaerolineae bacterium]